MYEVDIESKVLAYLPLVHRVVNRLNIKNFDYSTEDLFNTGVIGLIDAIHKYDSSKKVPFEGYAAFRIKGAIIDEIRRHARLPRNRMALVNKLYTTKEQLLHELDREPTDDEIAEKMAISGQQLSEVYDSMQFLAGVSLDATLFNSQNETFDLKETIADPNEKSGLVQLEEQDKRTALHHAIARLPERDQTILNLYYVDNLTLKEISIVLAISIARVSQLLGRITLNLKTMIEEELA